MKPSIKKAGAPLAAAIAGAAIGYFAWGAIAGTSENVTGGDSATDAGAAPTASPAARKIADEQWALVGPAGEDDPYRLFATVAGWGELGSPGAITVLIDKVNGANLGPTLTAFATDVLWTRLAELDLLRAIVANRRAEKTFAILSPASIIAKAALSDPAHRWQATRAIGKLEIPPSTVTKIIGHLANGDVAAANALTETVIPKEDDSRARLYTLVREDPAAAFAELATLPAREQKNQRRNLIRSLGETDPAAAWSYLSEATDIDDSGYTYSSVYSNWLEKDPATALSYLDEVTDKMGHYYFDNVSSELVKHDRQVALKWAEGIKNIRSRDSAYAGIISGLAEDDPASAARLLADVDTIQLSPDQTGTAYKALARTWAANDFKAALNWTKSLGGAERIAALGALVTNFGEHSDTALELIREEASRSDEIWSTVDDSINSLARENLEKTLEIIALAPEEQTGKLMGEVIEGLADSDRYAEAAEMAGSIGLTQEGMGREVQSLVTNWSQEEPDAARSWLESLPESEERAIGFQNVTDAWMRSDPDAALAWIGNLEDSPSRNRAVYGAAVQLAQRDPAASLALASSISDEQLRKNFLTYDDHGITALLALSEEESNSLLADPAFADDKTRERIEKALTTERESLEALTRGTRPGSTP